MYEFIQEYYKLLSSIFESKTNLLNVLVKNVVFEYLEIDTFNSVVIPFSAIVCKDLRSHNQTSLEPLNLYATVQFNFLNISEFKSLSELNASNIAYFQVPYDCVLENLNGVIGNPTVIANKYILSLEIYIYKYGNLISTELNTNVNGILFLPTRNNDKKIFVQAGTNIVLLCHICSSENTTKDIIHQTVNASLEMVPLNH